jgi:hypothetical protein
MFTPLHWVSKGKKKNKKGAFHFFETPPTDPLSLSLSLSLQGGKFWACYNYTTKSHPGLYIKFKFMAELSVDRVTIDFF